MLRRALWGFAAFCAVAAIYVMIQGLRNAKTDQDLANCAVIAISSALIPYCLARAVAEVSKAKDSC
jgi:nucleoside permease NupC